MNMQISHATPLWSMFLILLLVVGACIAIGVIAFTLLRKRGSSAASLVLLGAGGVGVCLLLPLLLWGVSHRVEVRQTQAIADHQQVFAELRAIEAERARRPGEPGHFEPTIPLEAPQPDANGNFTIAPGERLILDNPAPPLPEWLAAGTVDEGDGKLVVVQSEQFADPTTARNDALVKATELVREDFVSEYGQPWAALPAGTEWTKSHAVRRNHTEEIRRSAGDNEFTVYRESLQVEISPRVREMLEPIWREQVGQSRSYMAIALLAGLTALAGLVSGLFRLGNRTGPQRRWGLRVGAVATILLAGGALFAGSTMVYMLRSQPAPPSTPVDLPVPPFHARTSQRETRVDDEVQQRFQEVADRIVKAINAADYEGVRLDFNENMLDKFPVEECRAFFGEKISSKYGIITELEPPQFKSDSVAVFAARCERGTLNFTLVLDEQGQVAGLVLRRRSALPDGRG